MHITTFPSLDACQELWETTEKSTSHYPFQSWWYLHVFAKHFSNQANLYLLGVYEKDLLLALGAFEKVGENIVFLGTKDVSQTPGLVQDITDFGDLLFTPEGEEQAEKIWETIITCFQEKKIGTLSLSYVREDSPTYKVLHEKYETTQQEVSPYILLPKTWEEYLASLEKKQRHELKRKMNRLSHVQYSFKKEALDQQAFATFIRLHKLSDFNKEQFMTSSMEAFFWDVLQTPKKTWESCVYMLCIDNTEVSSVLVFENDTQILLYNSGFDPSFGYYSVGLLGKAFILQKAIEEKKTIYDFLRGNERYKYDLGAKDLPLYKIVLL